MALKPGRGLADWEIGVVKKVVSEGIRRHDVFGWQDFDDLVQECLAHWITIRDRLPQGPDIPVPVAYLAQVTRNKLSDWVRELKTAKRAGDPGALLFSEPIGADGRTLGDALAERVPDESASDAEKLHLRIEIVRVLSVMNPEDAALCRLLAEDGLSISDAAKKLGIPRATLYEQLKRIRERLRRLGLAIYLEK